MDEDEFNVEALTKQRQEKDARQKAEAVKAAGGDAQLEAILLETQNVRKDTVDSTDRSVKLLNETIGVADRTNQNLTAQGEQLERISGTADRADANANKSYDQAKELHKYKGLTPWSIKNAFKGKDKKMEDVKLEEARTEYEKGKTATAATGGAERSPPGQPAAGPKKQYANEDEQRINDNLDEISAGLTHLKASGQAMNQKMAQQQDTIKLIDKTTAHTDYTINSAGRKIKEFE